MTALNPSKRLLVQGCTGSVGRGVLSVVRAHADRFRIVGVAARSESKALLETVREFGVDSVAVEDPRAARARTRQWFAGPDALERQAAETDYDLLVNAVAGGAGLEATAAALSRALPIALANKETLVAAGPLIMEMAAKSGAPVIPIDSEHSAVFQCLAGESLDTVRRIWLTTSGGPFWGRDVSELGNVSVEETLAHPTWNMGPKITVDSATLFNKGLEVIEAQRLFGLDTDRIQVVVHRQSVVHSLVEFADGSLKAQLSVPDMRLPILFALSYPERLPSDLVTTSVADLGTLSFEPLPAAHFPCFSICVRALQIGGTAPAAISAADEVAVAAFLERRIHFTDIARVLEDVLNAWPDEPLSDIAGVRDADRRARESARRLIESLA